MPGVDFNQVRRDVTMEQGPRPARVHTQYELDRACNGTDDVRVKRVVVFASWSLVLGERGGLGRYHCHRCGSRGNPLELWAAATNLPLHQAAVALCHRLGRDVPWIRPLVMRLRTPRATGPS